MIEKGFITICPKLHGHTGNKKDLRGANYKQWIDSGEQAFLDIREKCDKIFLIGFSMGGLVAVNLAVKYNIDGIITLSSPIYHWDFKMIYKNILSDLKHKQFKHAKRYIKASSIPFSALFNFKVFQAKSKQLFQEIKVPLFVAQGMADDTVQHRSAEFIYSSAKSKEKSIKYYAKSHHLICCSEDSPQLFEDILDFVNMISME